MINPNALKYAESHEWVLLDGDVATVGISKFAVEQLTDLILIDLSKTKVGSKLEAGKTFGEVESVKAVADLYAPVSGEVLEINPAVTADVQVLASDPFGAGWLLKVKVSDPSRAVAALMDYNTYEAKVAESPH
jgi:glycine cleavage system H protein